MRIKNIAAALDELAENDTDTGERYGWHTAVLGLSCLLDL